MKSHFSSVRPFLLIELLVLVAVIGVWAAGGLSLFSGSSGSMSEAALVASSIFVMARTKAVVRRMPTRVIVDRVFAYKKIVFKVQVYKVPGDTAANVYSNIWAVDPTKRHLILILPSAESPSGVSVRRLSENADTIPAVEEDPSTKQQP